MNSDRILEQFGNYELSLLVQTDDVRLASLGSRHAGRFVPRTLALTRFNLPIPTPLRELHTRVRAGASLGACFRDAGWTVLRTGSVAGEITAGGAGLDAHFQIGADCLLCWHRYAFELVRAGRRFTYAQITEIHHPEHLNRVELTRLTPAARWIAPADSVAALAPLLQLLAGRDQQENAL